MARKGPLNKLVNAAFDAAKDPVGATGKTLGVAKEAVAIGRMLAGQVTRLVVDKAAETAGGSSGGSAPTQEPDVAAPSLRSVPPVKRPAEPVPVERSAPPVPAQSSDPATTGAPAKKAAQKAPAQKVPTKKTPARTAAAPTAPAGRAPTKKTPAKKTPAKKASAKVQGDPTMMTPADIAENVSKQPAKKAAKKTPAAKKTAAKAPAKKAPAKKAPAKKAPAKSATPATVAKKASAKKAARKPAAKTAKQVANVDGPPVTTPVGTTAAAQATNPDTTEHDLQQPGTEPIVDPGTAKAIRSEAQTLQRAADTDKS